MTVVIFKFRYNSEGNLVTRDWKASSKNTSTNTFNMMEFCNIGSSLKKTYTVNGPTDQTVGNSTNDSSSESRISTK